MPFSKCLRAKICSNINVYFDPLGCQTLLLKRATLFFSLWAPGLKHMMMKTILLIPRIFFQSFVVILQLKLSYIVPTIIPLQKQTNTI